MLLIRKWSLDLISISGAMIGSLLIALNSPELSKWGYVFFMASTVASIIIQKNSNVSRSQLIICCWFLLSNVIGLVQWFK